MFDKKQHNPIMEELGEWREWINRAPVGADEEIVFVSRRHSLVRRRDPREGHIIDARRTSLDLFRENHPQEKTEKPPAPERDTRLEMAVYANDKEEGGTGVYPAYEHLLEEERNELFREEAALRLGRKSARFSPRDIKILDKARAMADEANAAYRYWIGAQQRKYGRKLRTTHLNSKWATKIYEEFMAEGYGLPKIP